MKDKLTANDVTLAVKSAVAAVLLARAYAETKRAQVDEIARAVLAECPLKVRDKYRERGRPEYITDPKLTYLAIDSHFEDYLAECNKRERAAGVKPESMPDSHCPALVAEHVLADAEQVLLDCAGEMLGVPDFAERTTRSLDLYRQAINLLCGLVVNLPDFRHPLTGKAA